MKNGKYKKLKRLYYNNLKILSIIVCTNNALSIDYPSIEGTSQFEVKKIHPLMTEGTYEKLNRQAYRGKKDIMDYFTKENPDLLKEASKALPKNIPLSWYSDYNN